MHNTRLCQQHVCVPAEEEADRRGCWFWSRQKKTRFEQFRGHCQSLSQTGAPSNTHTRHPCKRPQTHARYTCAREPSHENPVARVWPRAWDQEHTTGPSQNDELVFLREIFFDRADEHAWTVVRGCRSAAENTRAWSKSHLLTADEWPLKCRSSVGSSGSPAILVEKPFPEFFKKTE